MRPVGLDVLALLTEPHAVVDGAVEDRQVGGQVLQQSCLFVGIFDLEKLIELFAGDLEGRRHDGDLSEDGLVVGPDQEDKADVIENEEEEGFDAALDALHAQLDDIGVPGPEKLARNETI